MKAHRYILAAALLVVASYNACQNTGTSDSMAQLNSAGSGGVGASGQTYLKDSDVLSKLPTGTAQLAVICSRPGQDKVRKAFCSGQAPNIRSLRDLEAVVGLDFTASPLPSFALTANSSSLLGKEVSAINPRAVIFSSPTSDFVTLGFVRGGKFAELIAGDPSTGQNAFYLVSFQQNCDLAGTCTNGDNLTPAVERNWVSYSIYEDEDLKNTYLDCRHCHQTEGPGTHKFLRMQEIVKPWTHWMENFLPGGQAILADFHAAHGTKEDYAGIPAAAIDNADPPGLNSFINLRAESGFQSNFFNSPTIEQEVQKASPKQPADNSVPGTSQTWQGIYANFVAGKSIQVPYHDVKVTDPAKLAMMTAAYKATLSGQMPLNQMPDIREVFPDDPARLAEMGFRVQPGQSAQGILLNACGQCHNSKLDQTLSRAQFSIDLTKMSLKEKQEAINRLTQPADSLQLMPPRLFRTLTPAEIQSLVGLLSK